MSESHPSPPTLVGSKAVGWLRGKTTVIPTESAVFRLEGPGVVECLQGILTNDVAGPGADRLIYGALLTPKGMIVVDLWVFRDHSGFTVFAPSTAHDATAEIFSKRFPPRLVTVKDYSTDWSTAWLAGSGSADTFAQIGTAFPTASWHTVALDSEGRLNVGRPGDEAPWSGLIVGANEQITSLLDQLRDAGVLIGGSDHQEALRIIGGWPQLGSEIGEKTLPQEVRLDHFGGLSHTKGCYVGQETVARIHFRGHPNRTLRGVLWNGPSLGPGTAISSGGKEVGRLTSVLEVDDARIGLSLIRREVETGAEVTLGEDGEIVARVALPPFWEAATNT